MRHLNLLTFGLLVTPLAFHAGEAQAAGVYYQDPGWRHVFDGDQAFYNDPDGPNPDYVNGNEQNEPGGKSHTAALVNPGLNGEGKVDNDHAPWLHLGSQWDGTAPGAALGGVPGNQPPIPPAAPGGVGAFADKNSSTSFIRLQDSGAPNAGWGFADKGQQAGPGKPKQEGSNRRIEFYHPLDRDAGYSGDNLFLDTGITLAFRIRVATAATGPLDQIYTEGGPSVSPPLAWPEQGIGYTLANGGRGALSVADLGGSTGRQFAFGLLNEGNRQYDGAYNFAPKTGLVFNSRAATPSGGGSVNTNDATDATLNVLEIPNEELTDWQEFWVNIKKLPNPLDGNTHEVSIFHNGSLTPQIFQAILSPQNQLNSVAALGIGVSSGTRFGAFDLDYFAYREGIVAPQAASVPLVGDYDRNGQVNGNDLTVWKQQFGLTGSGQGADGDNNGVVDGADFLLWQRHNGAGSAVAASSAVPEPSAGVLSLVPALAAFAFRNVRSRI